MARGSMFAAMLFLIILLVVNCSEKWPGDVPTSLDADTRLIALESGNSWTYRHSIYEVLPGASTYTDTAVWRVGQKILLGDKEYVQLSNMFIAREAEEGLYLAYFDRQSMKRLNEIYFKVPAMTNERYEYTFETADTTITYEIGFVITPIQNGDRYYGASYMVMKIDGEPAEKGPGFTFRPGEYIKAIDRFPAPPFHFWGIIDH